MESLACPAGNGQFRFCSHYDRHAQFLGKELVHAMKHRTSPGQDDTVFHDICRQFRRCFSQDILGQVQNLDQRLTDDPVDFAGFDAHFLLQAIVDATAREIISPVFQRQYS